MIKLSLAQQIRYTLVLITTLSALLFSTIAHFLIEDIEYNTFKAHLRNDLSHYIEEYKNDNDFIRVDLKDAYFVKYKIGDNAHLGPEIKYFTQGEHELKRPYGEDFVFVKDQGLHRYLLINKQEAFEKFESTSKLTLIIASFTVLLFSLITSWLLSKRILKPISELTKQLKFKYENQLNHQPISIQPTQDEVGFLVKNFNQYINRITQLLHREQLFTSDISHELRTPLMVIKSSIELLNSHPDQEKQRKLLNKIDSSTNEIQALIDTFISLAREKNQHQSNVLTQKLDAILIKRLEYWQPYAHQQNIKLTAHITPDIQTECSIPLFSTVVSNLIKNALLHSNSRLIDIHLSNESIRVIDHGPEISDDLKAVLFDAYQKGNTTSAGLGLGLSIIKRICEHQDWTVSYNFDSLQGSAFIIQFH